jgi:peptide methionine sulfoxide reductase MsrA
MELVATIPLRILVFMFIKVAARIEKAGKFCPAEEYRQNYMKKTGQRVCSIK